MTQISYTNIYKMYMQRTSDDILYIYIVEMYIYMHILFNTTCDTQWLLAVVSTTRTLLSGGKNIYFQEEGNSCIHSWNARQWLFPNSVEAAVTCV